MKKNVFFLLLVFVIAISACESKKKNYSTKDENTNTTPTQSTSDYDPKRGEGKFNVENLKLDDKIDDAMAESGAKIQGVKCSSCHKLGTDKLVGPGWKGVTERRTPSWIMNFITNPDPMINKDPQLQAQLELCLVRMPNQNLTDDDARHLLEFMRRNDKEK